MSKKIKLNYFVIYYIERIIYYVLLFFHIIHFFLRNPTPKITDLITTIWKPLEKTNTYNYLRIDKTLQMESYSKSGQRFDWKRIKNKL